MKKKISKVKLTKPATKTVVTTATPFTKPAQRTLRADILMHLDGALLERIDNHVFNLQQLHLSNPTSGKVTQQQLAHAKQLATAQGLPAANAYLKQCMAANPKLRLRKPSRTSFIMRMMIEGMVMYEIDPAKYSAALLYEPGTMTIEENTDTLAGTQRVVDAINHVR